jgi:mono/diheme cytochrome c family protein
MTKPSPQNSKPTRQYLISPGTLRNLFVVGWVVSILILVAILTMTASGERSRYTPADETQFQETLQAASTALEEPGVNELGAGRIPIERAMQIVSEKGLAQVGTELMSASAPPEASGPVGDNPYAGDQAAIAEGEALVMGELACGTCHGPDLTGAMGPNLTDSEWIYGDSDADLFETLTNGRPGGMPSFSAQTDEDTRWKVVSYLQSLSQAQ